MVRTLLIMCILNGTVVHGQNYFTKDAKVSFYSIAPLENIEAHNSKGVGVIKAQSGIVEFSVLLKGFEFQKALMQEHFNENYVESDKYPKASFKGVLPEGIKWATDGVYNVTATGIFSLHGISKSETVPVTVTVRNGIVSGNSEFQLKLADYKIKIPSIVNDKISKTVRVSVSVASFISSN